MDHMKDCKTWFTPEQIDQLHNYYMMLVKDAKERDPITWESCLTTPEPFPLSNETEELLSLKFEEYRKLYPEQYEPENVEDITDFYGELQLRFDDFILEVIGELFEDEIKKSADPEKTARALAIYGENTASLLITHPKLRGALLPQKNDTAYIINIDKQLQVTWDEDGNPHFNTVDEEEAYNGLLQREKIPAKCADVELLEALAGAVASAYIYNAGDRITVNLPSFINALNKRDGSESEHRTDIKKKLRELENIGGVLVQEKKIQRAFVLLEVNNHDNTITFESPYLYSIMDMLRKDPAKISPIMRNNRPLYKITGVSFLVRASIASAKNKTTAQIVKNLIAGLHQHGRRTVQQNDPQKVHDNPKLVKWSISYNDLIKFTPLLKEAIDSTPSRKTRILQRAILGAKYDQVDDKTKKVIKTSLVEEYLRTYTTAFDYWKDLQIKIDPITTKHLDNKITFTHRGYNGDKNNPLRLPEINGHERPATFE